MRIVHGRVVRGLLRLCAAAGIVVLLCGLAGAWHPVGDSLAILRLWIAGAVVLIALVLLITRDVWVGAYFAILAGVLGAEPVLNLARAPAVASPAQNYSLYQRNLLFLARDPGAVLAEIDARTPDFITFQEVSRDNTALVYERLPDGYDRTFCPFAGVGGVAIASRHSMVPGTELCLPGSGMAAAQVDTPDGLVWLVSVHLHWPWPYGQEAQIRQLLPLIARMDRPVMIAGDFNAVRWSHVMGEFERLSGARIAPQGRSTFHLTGRGWVGPGFEIDHILVPAMGEVTVERLDFLGSDHRGLLAHFAL